MIFDVDQQGWGSSKLYPDGALSGGYDPRYVIIHWGGLTLEQAPDSVAFDRLRRWQRYHLSKGWQDIAYNYGCTEDGTLVRLRGENHGGHASGTDPVTGMSWGTCSVGVVWVGGKGDTNGPSDAARAAMRRFCDDRGLPVMGHNDAKPGPYGTECPGPYWKQWIDEYTPGTPPVEAEPMITPGYPVTHVVEDIQNRLLFWDAAALPRFGADGDYGSETADWVGRFQTANSITTTGNVDGLTYSLLQEYDPDNIGVIPDIDVATEMIEVVKSVTVTGI